MGATHVLAYFGSNEVPSLKFWSSRNVTKQVRCSNFRERTTGISTEGVVYASLYYSLFPQANVRPQRPSHEIGSGAMELCGPEVASTHTGHHPFWRTNFVGRGKITIAISYVHGKFDSEVSVIRVSLETFTWQVGSCSVFFTMGRAFISEKLANKWPLFRFRIIKGRGGGSQLVFAVYRVRK